MIPVDDITNFLTSGTVQIDHEQMIYNGIQATGGSGGLEKGSAPQPGVLLNVQRGVNGTAPAPHAGGAVVTLLAVHTCVGDCDGHGSVTLDDLLTLVNIALGNSHPSTCPMGGTDSVGRIPVDAIIWAVNNATTECGAEGNGE